MDLKNLENLATSVGEAEAIDWLAGRSEFLLEALINWSHVNSGSTNRDGLIDMQKIIVDYVAPLNASVELVDLAPVERVDRKGHVFLEHVPAAIHIRSHQQADKRVLMTGHYDTVFPADSHFQTTSWRGDGALGGPGVADMKGGILVMLTALMAFEKTSLAGSLGYEVVLSPDEETGSLASAPLLVDRAAYADIGMTYEPALPDGTLAGARKGSGNFTLVVRGRAAHAGREFFEGRNAVIKLADIAGDLAALTGGRDGLTLNCATLSGGVAPNIVPDHAQMKFNVRLETVEDGHWVEGAIQNILDKHSEDGFELHLHGGINRPPKHISAANHRLMEVVSELGAELGQTIRYVATGGCCEGNNLAAAGLPNIDTLGVRGGAIHSDAEYMWPDSLVERSLLSLRVLTALANGRLDDVVTLRRAQNEGQRK